MILKPLKKGNEGSDFSNLSPVDGLMQKINIYKLNGPSLSCHISCGTKNNNENEKECLT